MFWIFGTKSLNLTPREYNDPTEFTPFSFLTLNDAKYERHLLMTNTFLNVCQEN